MTQHSDIRKENRSRWGFIAGLFPACIVNALIRVRRRMGRSRRTDDYRSRTAGTKEANTITDTQAFQALGARLRDERNYQDAMTFTNEHTSESTPYEPTE